MPNINIEALITAAQNRYRFIFKTSEAHNTRTKGESCMTLHLELAPLISLGAGIGILVFPKLLNYIVAGYLIVLGVLGLFGHSL